MLCWRARRLRTGPSVLELIRLSEFPYDSKHVDFEVDGGSWWEIEERRGWIDPFPGLNMRKVDMTAYNDPRETLDRRQLQYYKVLGNMPAIDEDPNLHAVAHLYASDRNGLFFVGFHTKPETVKTIC
jgi:hypothetical protein